jgi:hypothetical protein
VKDVVMRAWLPVFAVAVLGAGLHAGCRAFEPLPELHGGVELGLRRGPRWSHVTVRPPYVIGPRDNLRIRKGKLQGSLDSNLVYIETDRDGATGSIGQKAIELAIENGPDELTVWGNWRYGPVHLHITPERFEASIATGGLDRYPLTASVRFCQYVLDQTTEDGARTGTSICEGMPQDTRLEVPAQLYSWLTHSELTVLLLSMLSAPPQPSI